MRIVYFHFLYMVTLGVRHLSFSRNSSSYINLYPPGFTSPLHPWTLKSSSGNWSRHAQVLYSISLTLVIGWEDSCISWHWNHDIQLLYLKLLGKRSSLFWAYKLAECSSEGAWGEHGRIVGLNLATEEESED